MRSLCLALIILASAASGYLLVRYFAIAGWPNDPGRDVCSALFGTGCDEALRSPMSIQLGIPVAGWGLVYYATLLALLLLGWSLGDLFEPEATLGALVLSVLAALVSIGLAATMVMGPVRLCPLCAAVTVINLALVAVLKSLSGRSMPQALRTLAAGGRYFLGGGTAGTVATRWKPVGFLAAGLVAVALYQWVMIEAVRRRPPAEPRFDPSEALVAFAAGPLHDIPIDADDATSGPPDAPIRLVVFSDFQCPGCRRFSLDMAALAKRFAAELQIVFKHFPLGAACNSAITVDLHPRACEAARAAQAAQRQGRFWTFHDALFASDFGSSGTTLDAIAHQAGLNLQRFAENRGQAAVSAKVQSDVGLGIRLGVDATPSVFLNGRRAHDTRAEALRVLIAHEIERAGH